MAIPIWKDTYYTFNTIYSSVVYAIKLDGAVIFNGKAYKSPNKSDITININKICQNYLRTNIEPVLQSYIDNGEWPENNLLDGIVYTFSLVDSEDNVLENYDFINDWSYERMEVGYGTLDAPINGHYTPRMLRLSTRFEGVDSVYLDNDSDKYNIVGCGDYAVYYQNLYGGFDSLLLESVKSTVKDNYTTHLYNKSFNNTTIAFEEGRYIAEIRTMYDLGTGLLTDEEAEILTKHLLSSNNVYLHDLVNDKIFPVLISNKEGVYKTKENQKGPVAYRIQFTASQSKIRK